MNSWSDIFMLEKRILLLLLMLFKETVSPDVLILVSFALALNWCKWKVHGH